jgi:multidrug efflux pump subunit AcrB
LSAFLKSAELKRPSGKVAHFTNVTISSPDEFIRSKNEAIITVTGSFDGSDTSTLVTLAQTAVKDHYPAQKVEKFGLPANAISFDLGQESQNQNSFNTLLLAFPVLLLVMYLLLMFQFRSFLQPLLIFMAIPFSIFGIMLGLSITDNAISFFALLGFFALVGLSIKNTILLTDFANQSRRSGHGAIDAAVEALEERFRPLIATSLTAVSLTHSTGAL